MASIPPFATPQSKQHPKGEAIPSPIANDQKPVQTPEQNPALETQAAQSQQQPKGKEIPSPTADEQKAVQPQHSQTTQQHPKDKEISSPNATEANVPTQEVAAKAPYADEPTQESKKTSYNIPDEYPQDRVAEVPILHNTEFSLWNKLSALLMDTSEEKHMKTAPNEILVLETDEDQGLSDMEKMHLTEVWQHPSEGIISFTIEGSNEVLDLSDFPEFIPQVFDYVSQGAMDMTEEKGRPEELEMPKPKDLVFTYDMATQTPKDRPSDIVFVKDTDPVSHTPTYTAYGRDADRLAEKVSSSIAAMRTEINGRRYPNATVNEGNLDAVRADLMTKNVQPVIIDTKGVRITDDNKLDYTKEERKAFLNSLKPETQQLKNINETLQRMGNPDSILLPQNYGRPSGSRELFIPHRFGYQEINFAEIKRFKDGSYRAGNKDEGYYPIAKMDTNNLSTVEQALHHAWLNMPQNLVKELVLQVQSGKAEVEHDNAKGRYVVTINDPEGRFGPYERGFKKFTVGADLPNEVLLHKDWNNWTSAIKVDPDTVRQIVSYAESKIDSKLSKNRNALSHAHTIDDFTLRNVSGDWRLSANIDGKRMPEVSIDHKDVIELKHGRMSQEEITLKSYHEMLSDKQQQSHVRGRGMH